MPYSSVKDLPPSTKSLNTQQKKKFMEVFNAMIEQGMKEDLAFPVAMKQAKRIKKKSITKATTESVEKDDKGNLVYRGIKFPAYNKPIKSNREGKQGMVLAKKGDEIKVVHFGDPSMEDNYSVEANDAYYARHGEESDVFSAKYWSNKYLWPKGKMKGKGPKEFHTLKKNLMDFNLKNIIDVLTKSFGHSEQTEEIVDVLKSNNKEQMIAYEVVYEPNVKDAHEQWMSEETLIKACENFNKNLEAGIVQPNLFHLTNTDMFKIEKSWIQEELDVVVEETGEKIKAGTWVVKVQYLNEDLWNIKKAGIIQGVSISGRGVVNEETGEITDVSFDPIEQTEESEE